ncbi:MAG: S1C family serine protease [Planctomycetota bacterium]
MTGRTARSLWIGWILLASLASATLAQDTLVSIREREKRVRSVISKVLPCTVGIRSNGGGGGGSGVLVSEDGLVLTAAHVTQASGDSVTLLFADGREVQGKALGANRTTDAGMIQIVGDVGPLPYVELGPPVTVDQWCLSLGHPGGFDPKRPPPVRLGQILDLGRFLVTDCTLTNGDSGGPLFDLDGRLIGIHSSIGTSLVNNNHVPMAAFRTDWDKMKSGETWGNLRSFVRQRAILGFRLDKRPARGGGFRVLRVIPGTPAAEEGILAGDRILAYDDIPLVSLEQLRDAMTQRSPGDRMLLTVRRGDEELEMDLELISSEDLSEEE